MHPDITPRCSDAILDSRGGAARAAPLRADPPRPSPSRRCRFNPIGRPLGVCMAMHYSSNDKRAATIVAYPKEGNATGPKCSIFTVPGAIPLSAILNRGHCPVGLTGLLRVGVPEIQPENSMF